MAPPFVKTPFAGGEATQLHDESTINHMQHIIARSLGSTAAPDVTPRVVPPLPISPETRHKAVIKNSPFLYSEKADGVRYIMVLCVAFVNGKWRRLCVLCGRNREAFVVPLVIGDRLFVKESVFDGELVKRWDGSWVFLFFDAYMYEGVVLCKKTFSERASYYQRFVDENYAYMPADPFQVKCKKFSLLRHASAETLQAIMTNDASTRTYDYPTDGVVLVHAQSDVHAGTNKGMFKFKNVHTLDLTVQPHPDGHGYVLCSATHEPHRSGTETATMVPHAAIDELPEGMGLGDIVECALRWEADAARMHIVPLHVRKDKSEPNSSFVCERTFQTVKDALTLQELILP
jgi:mRNA capping enzyme, catalytic domain